METSRATRIPGSGYVEEAVPEEEGRGRRWGCGVWIAILLVLIGGGAATGYLAGTFALRQDKPTDIEATLADTGLRLLAVPGEYHDWPMPAEAKKPASIAQGKDLFGAQCSMCHGNAGKGDGSFGKTEFPPAANLTADRTKTKTDGMLFWEIWHGVNYTGMPAFGDGQRGGKGNSQAEIWTLVAYIRSLQGSLPTAK